MIFRSSIRAKLFLAFTLSAVPVVLTGLIMILRHPAQFTEIESRIAESRINLKALRNAHSVIAEGRHGTESAEDILSLLNTRIVENKLSAGLATELQIILLRFIAAPAGVPGSDKRSAISLIEQIQFEEETNLVELTREMLTTARRLQRVQLVQIIIACLLVLLLSLHFGRHFSEPLVRLRSSIEKIRAGQLGTQTELAGDDELGVVIATFNEMSDELQKNLVSKEYLDRILANINEGLIVLNSKQQIEYVNSSFEILSGYRESSLLGMDVSELFEDSNSNYITVLKPASKESIPVSLSRSTVDGNDGETRTVITAHDERERLKAREERENIKAKLAHSERLASLGTLSGEVAHRLNQPLTSLRLFLQQIRRKIRELEVEDESLNNNIELCLKEIGRATDAVKRILTYTRREPEVKCKLTIEDLAKRTALVFSERLRLNGISLSSSGDETTSLFCAPSELEELLFILVNNAIDAIGADGGAIAIDWVKTATGVTLTVSDSGPGIPEETLDKVFEVFFTTKAAGKGTGLGLSIAKKIAEDHGASIEVSNSPAGGAQFVIQFKQSDSTVKEAIA